MHLLVSLALVIATTTGDSLAAPGTSSAHALACRALEVHEDATLGVTVVLFHQRDDDDRGRVSALLRERDGARIEFQAGDGAWHPATLMRLKSCFGRGLLLFPAGAARLAERDELLLRETAGGTK